MIECKDSDFSHKEYLDKTNVDLIIKCPSYQQAEETKKQILNNQEKVILIKSFCELTLTSQPLSKDLVAGMRTILKLLEEDLE